MPDARPVSLYVVAVGEPIWVKLAPGDPISILMPPDAGKAEIEAVKEALGIDRPLPVQYVKWLERVVVHGDLGRSIATRRPVVQDVMDALRNSVILAVASSLLALAPGLVLGTLAAFWRGALVDKIVTRFGRLDIAVNNAATEGQRGLVTEQTADSYAATFDTNVLGVLLSMKHELRVMLPQRSGSIVNVSSAYGTVGAAGASVYVGSKHAVEGITKSAALEVAGSGVRVNVVAPGTTDTGMLTRFTNTAEDKAALVSTVPFKRLATPDEIARVIVFVASADASYMTGAFIPVDGGMLAD